MKTYALGTDVNITIESKNVEKDVTDTAYEEKIAGLLGQIAGATVGAILFRAMSLCSGKAIEIRKYNVSMSWSFDAVCEVVTLPQDTGTYGRRQSVEEGRSIKGDRRNEDRKNKHYYEPGSLGTGAGADARITFTPGLWAETDGYCRRSGSKLGGPGSSPDAVLFHELVHAYRHITGSRLEYSRTVDGFPSQKYEEFVAILVTNVYLSAANSTQLRSFNHDVIDVMADPKNYMNRNGNRQMVEELCGSSKIRPFLMELALVPCDFNPLAEVLYPRGDFAGRSAALA